MSIETKHFITTFPHLLLRRCWTASNHFMSKSTNACFHISLHRWNRQKPAVNFAFFLCCNIFSQKHGKFSKSKDDSIERCSFYWSEKIFQWKAKLKRFPWVDARRRWCNRLFFFAFIFWYNLNWFLCNFQDFAWLLLRAVAIFYSSRRWKKFD